MAHDARSRPALLQSVWSVRTTVYDHQGFPVRDWWSPQRGWYSPQYRQWRATNRANAFIARHQDVICPSLYTMKPDEPKFRNQWRRFALGMIREAGGRPGRRSYPSRMYGTYVCPALWPRYHPAAHIDGLVPADWLIEQIDFVLHNADGLIMWGKFSDADEYSDDVPWIAHIRSKWS
jgi:hypothetical protein